MPTKPVKPVNASEQREVAKKNKSEDDDGSVPRWKGVGKSDGRKKASRRKGNHSRGDKEQRASKDSQVPPEGIPFASRSPIKVVTMNLSGRNAMGYTPRHKLQKIEDFLKDFADVVFIQDSIDVADITPILESVSEGGYDFHFSTQLSDGGGKWEGEAERSITGIAWNKTKYFGTPLQLGDTELEKYVGWLQRHDVLTVKLDSKTRHKGWIDEYPSLIAIAWHGPVYEIALRDRIRTSEELFAFISILRSKNCGVPVLVGGDWNMDMRSQLPSKAYPEFGHVPYRPMSGKRARDLRNTFVYTLDNLQVSETGVKQAHPEVFATPFITAVVRGKTKTHIWAVVRIQRMVRRFLKRRQAREENKRRAEENRARWRKKISGDDLAHEEAPMGTGNRTQGVFERSDAEVAGPRGQDRKYALYWDQADDPNYNASGERGRQTGRGTENDGGGRSAADVEEVAPFPYRRRRFDDLKSMQERKKEAAEADQAFNYGWVDY